ncbi:MAG: hypothetical protein HFH79_06735 [Lachnospiraceae bacterium]|nr:hypothetical protein [Lachnospiraceae bacterium]
MQMNMNMIDNYRSFQVQKYNPAALMRGKVQQTAKAQDVFGAQCKVTISREGRKMSEEAKTGTKGVAAGVAERRLLRAQEHKENEQKEHTSILEKISSMMSDVQSSFSAGADEGAMEKKQEALQRLIDLKARQEEENKQQVENAADSAAAASKGQEEIDQKNADLYMMLKSFEEDDGEGTGEGAADKPSGAAQEEKLGNADQFDHTATMLGVSAARRELQAAAVIDELMNDGYDKINQSYAMMHEVQNELALAQEAAGKDHLSDEERRELVNGHLASANGMKTNDREMMKLREAGIQETKAARELELKHIKLTPLDGVDRARQSILDSGVDAALNEVSQGTIEKASDELEQRVQELIDKRNDITSSTEETEEAQETAEKTDEIIMDKDEEQKAEDEALLETE